MHFIILIGVSYVNSDNLMTQNEYSVFAVRQTEQ